MEMNEQRIREIIREELKIWSQEVLLPVLRPADYLPKRLEALGLQLGVSLPRLSHVAQSNFSSLFEQNGGSVQDSETEQ